MKSTGMMAAVRLSIVMLFATLLATPAPAEVINGNCTLSKVRFKTSDVVVSTTSTSFVNVPDMNVKFATSITTCLKVEFSAEPSTEVGQLMAVQAQLDGVTLGSPFAVALSYNESNGSRGFNFGFTNVGAGGHTLTIQWVSVYGGIVALGKRSLFVHYQ